MIKIIGIVALALICFMGTLVGMMAVTGHLNKESLQGLMGKEKEAVEEEIEPDSVSVLAKALKDKEKNLNDKEVLLTEREQRIEQRRQELVTLKDELTTLQKVIDDSLATSDAEHEKRILDVATSLAGMKAANAAGVMDSWPSLEEASEILRRIKEKDRGKILDKMQPKRATEILRLIQERKI